MVERKKKHCAPRGGDDDHDDDDHDEKKSVMLGQLKRPADSKSHSSFTGTKVLGVST